MIRKLLICPWFGPLPEWFPLWKANIARLEPHGYDVLVTTDLQDFQRRTRETLLIDCPIEEGDRKLCDFRCAFGMLFANEIDGYDFWGHTDFDCVYGRVEKWVTDEFLDGLDMHSNHPGYMAGPWSLYRNTPVVNTLFLQSDQWQANLENPSLTGWGEKEFTRVLDEAHDLGVIHRAYTNWQTKNLDSFDAVRFDGDRLMEGRAEVMIAHFRRTKEYPAGCK